MLEKPPRFYIGTLGALFDILRPRAQLGGCQGDTVSPRIEPREYLEFVDLIFIYIMAPSYHSGNIKSLREFKYNYDI